ncbi:hypothetical protein [Rhodobacter sp. CZR27]|uniref:hypothetical protein n=1 Tax=Rhodobacter sp. CZR27 TaxID=2033869 RepID=UPI001E3573FA|nr:hypothetical protein [Rhodobacter sp. CZR27]
MALRANPLDIREQYEKQLKDLQEAYGEAMLELRARKKLQALLDAADRAMEPPLVRGPWRGNDPEHPAGPSGRWDHGAADQAVCVVRRAAADRVLQADESCAEG